MNRTWVYDRLINSTEVTNLVGSRIYQDTALREDISTRGLTKPYIVYRIWGERPELRGDESDTVTREVCQMFVHDEPGDYLQIDSIISKLRTLFGDVRDSGIISEWLEVSEDFRDEDAHTIMRYCRIQLKAR